MKTFKRLTAMVLAIAAMAAGMSSVAVDAVELSELSSAEQALLNEELSAVASSEIEYYEYYDYHNDSALAPTPHYVAFFNATSLSSCYLSFYLNRNIDNNNPLLSSNYGSGASNLTVTPSGEVPENNTTDSRCYKVHLGITGSVPALSLAMYYNLSDNLNAAASEEDLDYFTSRFDDTIDRTFYTSNGKALKKCVIAKGDVNRDGVINANDSTMILKYLTSQTASSRSGNNGAYDQLAFEFAADVIFNNTTSNLENGDGTVTLTDAIAINQYILSH